MATESDSSEWIFRGPNRFRRISNTSFRVSVERPFLVARRPLNWSNMSWPHWRDCRSITASSNSMHRNLRVPMGSCLPFVQVLLDAGIVEQSAKRDLLVVCEESRSSSPAEGSEISVGPVFRRTLVVTYELDYGPRSPIKPQLLTFEFTPETFVANIAYARTFILESEVAALKAQGYGTRVTEKDLLIFGENGVIGNQLRAPA